MVEDKSLIGQFAKREKYVDGIILRFYFSTLVTQIYIFISYYIISMIYYFTFLDTFAINIFGKIVNLVKHERLIIQYIHITINFADICVFPL